MKPIRLSTHALGYLESRGFTIWEVEETIRACAWKPADLGKLKARMGFPLVSQWWFQSKFRGISLVFLTLLGFNFGRKWEWHGKAYETKQVRPIFVEEAGEIVVITVYTSFY